jgi:cysteine desulfuration protein SufE
LLAPHYMSGMNERIEKIVEDFELLDSWDDRYRYVIELGRKLPELPAADHIDANKVQGCASQVWMTSERKPDHILEFQGDSDAHIVKGLIAILFALYSGENAKKIIETDANAVFNKLGLGEHLTPQRSNGFRSMVDRMKRDAQAALAS